VVRRRHGLLVAGALLVLALAAFGLARLLGGAGLGGSASPSTSTTGTGANGSAASGASPGTGSSTPSTDNSGGSGRGSGGGSGSSTVGGTSGGTSSGGSSSGSGGSASGTSAVPAGFRRYTDPTGFSLAIPTGWTVTRNGSDVTFHQRGGRAYLLVPQTTKPEPDSLVDWQNQERAASPHFPGYQRIRLERVSFHRGWDVADWEFRWAPSGGTLHVLDRNLRISDRRAYALYWSVPEQDWAGMWRTFTVIATSFRPAG